MKNPKKKCGIEKFVSQEMMIKELQAELAYANQEIEFLKKNCCFGRGRSEVMKVSPSAKYQLIYEMTNQPENALSVSKLCEIACVSRSGYYDWSLMQKNGGSSISSMKPCRRNI